jgi:hypothetical protein
MDPVLGVVEVNTVAEHIVLFGAVVTAILGIFTALYKSWRFFARLASKFGDFFDDWNGEPDRPGVPGHAGVMARMQRMEAENYTNGGASLRDAIDRIDERSANIESLVRQHMQDGRNLLDVGLKNDKNLWDGLDKAGIKIEPYIPLDRDVLDRNSDLYDKLFPGQPDLFGAYNDEVKRAFGEAQPPDEPEA